MLYAKQKYWLVVVSIFCFPSLHVELPAAQVLQQNINIIARYAYRYWREKSLAYCIIKAIMKRTHISRIQNLNFVTFCALF